ncbi:hypothetical protein [Thermonema sp.]|nr:hypothetical protein [Thermonema sp.]
MRIDTRTGEYVSRAK